MTKLGNKCEVHSLSFQKYQNPSDPVDVGIFAIINFSLNGFCMRMVARGKDEDSAIVALFGEVIRRIDPHLLEIAGLNYGVPPPNVAARNGTTTRFYD
jgi:hypothetical protein